MAEVLDPVLGPLGFAAGQGGASDGSAQVIFCRGMHDSTDDGCVDLVIELVSTPAWRLNDVRYWGFTSDRWHLDFPVEASLEEQLVSLAETLPGVLG